MSNRVALLNVTAAAVILAAGFSAHLAAQSPSNYSIQQVVIDGVTPRPDGLGAFAVLGGLGSFPVIDGDWIVFRSATPGCTPEPDSYYSPCFELWSVNFTNNTFVKLVDGNTHVPQGTGNFSLLGTAGCTHPQARGGRGDLCSAGCRPGHRHILRSDRRRAGQIDRQHQHGGAHRWKLRQLRNWVWRH